MLETDANIIEKSAMEIENEKLKAALSRIIYYKDELPLPITHRQAKEFALQVAKDTLTECYYKPNLTDRVNALEDRLNRLERINAVWDAEGMPNQAVG